MAQLPKRKPLRLSGYDYSSPGAYFLTLCAKEKAPLFGDIVGGGVLDAPELALTDYGRTVEAQLAALRTHESAACIEAYVLMPNHLHLLVRLAGTGPSGTPAPTGGGANAAVPALVSYLKRSTNRTCGVSLCQRGYHDHIVRDENDRLRILAYIEQNPAKWSEDCYYMREKTKE